MAITAYFFANHCRLKATRGALYDSYMTIRNSSTSALNNIMLLHWGKEAALATQKRPGLVRTPNRGIPIGKPVHKANGIYVLKVKRADKDEYDEIPLEELYSNVIKNAEEEET